MTLESPLLSAIPGLHHAFFSREGGISEGIYAGLNGGIGSKDNPAHVMENRRRMANVLRVAPERFLTAFQIHSPDVAVASRPWDTATHPKARVIGAAHAGWKGALTGVVEATVEAMETLGAERANVVAAIGPLIRQPSYEVGNEFVERFVEADAENSIYFLPGTREGHAMFDLAGFIRRRLENAGVLMIDDTGIDTYSDERFFSYRRSVHRKEADYGRHVHAIVLQS